MKRFRLPNWVKHLFCALTAHSYKSSYRRGLLRNAAGTFRDSAVYKCKRCEHCRIVDMKDVPQFERSVNISHWINL